MYMKKAKLWLIAVLSLALGMGVLAACTPQEEEKGEAITLNYTAYELDLHEQVQLTAQTQAGEVVWSSSSTAVATVEDGLVKSVAAGTAVITAAAGDASATCQITVTNSMSAPVLTLTYDEISLDREEELTVGAEVTYKGNAPIDPVSYTWTPAEGAQDYISLTPSADGTSAVIKGVAYGETSFSVSSVLWGVSMKETVSVKVCNTSISFEVEGLTPVEGGYAASLSLIQTQDHDVSVTPVVTVLDNGVPVADAEIVWTSENDGVVSVEDGTYTALKAGTATFTGTYADNTIKLFITVVRPTVTVEEPVVLETSVGSLQIDLDGTVSGATLNNVQVFKSYDAQTGVLTLDKSVLPVTAADMGEKTLTIETDRAIYSVSVTVYTQVINTAEELANWGSLARTDEAAIWDGWFVLGNNIDFGGETYIPFNDYNAVVAAGAPDASALDGRMYGFRGIFDGQGYIIDDIQMQCGASGGFVGLLHQNGIIRNVAFTNAVHLGWGGFVVSSGCGRVENVYVSCLLQNGGNNIDRSGFIFGRDVMAAGRAVHCFIEIREVASGATDAYSIGVTHEGYGILDGVYTVGNPNGVYTISTGSGAYNLYGAYADYAAFLAAEIDFSDWDTDFWKFVDGIPFPKNLEVPQVTVRLQTSPSENGTVALAKEDGYKYGEAVVLTVSPAEGYKLSSLVADGVDLTASVSEGKVTLGYAYGEEAYTIQATFVADLPAYNVTFTADAKWGADGMIITMTKDGVTKQVTLGANATVEGMDVGTWAATTVIGGMTVSLGNFDIQSENYHIDLSAIFGDTKGAVVNADLSDGSFTYATGNIGNVVMNVDLAEGDAFFALTIKLDKAAVEAGAGWNCIGMTFVIGGQTFQAALLYSSDPNNAADYQKAYLYWANNPTWTATNYLSDAFCQALVNGEEAILAFAYRAETGALEVYGGTSAENMTIAAMNGHDGNDMALGTLPANAQITSVSICDTWGGVKSNISVKISYGKTLAEALGAADANGTQEN